MKPRMKLPQNQIYAVILGIMQDGGLPHIGCHCHRCSAAYKDPQASQYTACLGIIDQRRHPLRIWLIDATPDIKYQLELLGDMLGGHPEMPGRLRQPDGIFLTHAHMGHTAGLAQLGPEGMNVHDLPLYASDKLINKLLGMEIWGPLVNNLSLTPLKPGISIELAPELTITPIPVIHRDEIGAGTFAYLCSGPSRSLLYLPDIDQWDSFTETRAALGIVNVALVDASFFSQQELGGRPPVAHPLVSDTITYWAGSSTQLILTHINHTNPILDEKSEARQEVDMAGVTVARTGEVFPL